MRLHQIVDARADGGNLVALKNDEQERAKRHQFPSNQEGMLFPGAVNIYYGEEIGLDGALNNGTRRTMPWSRKSLWKRGIYDFYRRIIEIRKNCLAVKDGKFSFLKKYEESLLAFERKNNSGRIVCIMNCSDSLQTAESVHGRIILSEGMKESAGKITLAPRGFAVFN